MRVGDLTEKVEGGRKKYTTKNSIKKQATKEDKVFTNHRLRRVVFPVCMESFFNRTARRHFQMSQGSEQIF